jgi:hypothetical protein
LSDGGQPCIVLDFSIQPKYLDREC